MKRLRLPSKKAKNNISLVCENGQWDVLRHAHEQQWREDHAQFIAAYNATVKKEGLPLDEWRNF